MKKKSSGDCSQVEIYSSYDDEPETIFRPLPEKLYPDLYALEMDGFREDIFFYNSYLPAKCSLLEMGCGTGRITRAVACRDRKVIGIDRSLHMLKNAAKKKTVHCEYICMDIKQLSFTQPFDAILIAYNTLNLLPGKTEILSCLRDCRSLLSDSGKIYLQLFIPDKKITSHKGKIFQFQIFHRQNGEKIIKEILKHYSAENQTIAIEERYRIRPAQAESEKQDWSRSFSIAALPYDGWVTLIRQAGLRIIKAFSDYDLRPFQEDGSCCLLAILAA